MVPLAWYLVFAALLFAVGMFGVLSRKNLVAMLMGIELMLNAVIINIVAFWRFNEPLGVGGQVFAIIVFAIAAAESAVGLALAISIYRRRETVVAEDLDELKY